MEERVENITMQTQDDADKGGDKAATSQPAGGEEEVHQPDLNNLVEESLRSIQEGEVVQGRIIKITKEHVVVDVGYKSEGQIPIGEFLNEKGEVTTKEGDVVDVLLERWENEDGEILLSKEKAAKIKVWDEVRRAHNDNLSMPGKILDRVKGGYTVDIGVNAFLPGSQVDLRPVRDMDALVGQTMEFRILKYNKKRSNVVVSRRVLLEERRESQRSKTLKKIQELEVLPGVVKNITDYGAFIDLGGLDGLLHVTDISWGRVTHPSQILNMGDKINVKILHFDPETQRVSLGLKQLVQDPWLEAPKKYPVGTKVRGKVVSLTDYGAFIEVEEGIEGLIHLSEMSWTKKMRHPSQVVSVGDEVEAVVLDINPEARRISLGLKQVEPNPWEVIGQKYPVGTIIEGKIKNITDFGIFIGIDEGIDGLVHISDLSWTKRVKHPSELFKKGQEVQAKVLKIDRENERFSLSIKHVTPDPWEEIPKKYKPKSKVTGTITNVTDFGIFVEIEEGIEGLVHVSEISNEKIKTPVGQFQAGQVIEAQVVNVNKKERKIALSMKRIDEDEDKVLVREYLTGGQSPFSRLGEILKENLENKVREKEEKAQENSSQQDSNREPFKQ
jgi:small subunit ribosomal protein S1